MKHSIEKCEKLVQYMKKYSSGDLFQTNRILNFKENDGNLQGFSILAFPE